VLKSTSRAEPAVSSSENANSTEREAEAADKSLDLTFTGARPDESLLGRGDGVSEGQQDGPLPFAS
jgi:hypothetical protein